jgi:hypothetical protein|tara:strand:- start:554 stop:748 length:195 start_codon:yes stop_codon:yes gene_type:complete
MCLCFGKLIPASLSQQYSSVFPAKCPILPDAIFCQRIKYNGLTKKTDNNIIDATIYKKIFAKVL